MLKGMLKRIGSFLLTLVMVLSMIPATHAHAAAAHTAHPICGSSCGCSGTTHSNLSSWTAWDGTTRMYSNGNYYLTKDVVLSNTLILDYSYNTTLCLNGHTITCEDTVFDIYSYRSLWITDCKGTGVIESTGSSCTIGNSKYLCLWNGTIRNSGHGSAINSYVNTTTYVCGGTVESNYDNAIYTQYGVDLEIIGGTVQGRNYEAIYGYYLDGYTNELTVSGGSILSPEGYGLVWQGDFEMTGGYINTYMTVYGEDAAARVTGGTIEEGLWTEEGADATITGGQLSEFVTYGDQTTISGGTFTGLNRLAGTKQTVSGGNFYNVDSLAVASPTWIYGGTFNEITAEVGNLYLSGQPSIEKLRLSKPNILSAKSENGSASYSGDPIPIELRSNKTWNSGDVIVTNVTSDALAQKFVLSDDTGLRYLERSGNNLVLRIIPGGSCGTNANWKYQNGVLTISGTGAITRNFSGKDYPWGNYVDEIRQIVVESGITSIPSYAFEHCENATTITLPDTLTSLCLNAFNDCGSLNNLILPENVVVDPSENRFIRCESLTDLYFMGTEEEWEAKTSVTPVSSLNSTMTVHCLQYYPGTADCVTVGTESYYRFDGSSVYPGYYNAQKQPISQPATGAALGHRVITQQATSVDPIRLENTSAIPFTLESGKYYSNNHDNNSSTQMVIHADDACDVTITYGVSSEYNYDKLYLLHNGSQIAMISGSVTSQSKSVSMSAGDTLTVRYFKDVSQSSGSDRGWFSLSYDLLEKTEETVVSADTLSADCTNAVVCDFCGEVAKPALGHRAVRQQQITVDPIVVENTAATPYSLENGTYYSTNHTHNSSSELRLRAVQPCTLQLSYGVSSESSYDYLKIYQNSTQKASISGSYSNRSLSLTLAQGDVVKVVYSKDGSQSTGSDRGWVKPTYSKVTTTGPVEVVIDPATLGCSETVACDYCGEEFHGEGNHNFVDNVCSDCGAVTGYCGDPTLTDVSWTFDDGMLTIAGTGKMKSYASVNKIYEAIVSIDYLTKPWNSYSVTSGVVEEGVTMLGGGTFRSRSGFTQISLPDSLKIIDDCAFEECTGLQSVTIPKNVSSIYEYAFNGCTSLHEITFEGGAPTYIAPYAFRNVTATCYYPAIPSWTAEKRQNYGGNLTWVPYGVCTEGHTWVDATCNVPKTCSVCGETEGEPAADRHNFVGETCSVCGILGGSCGSNMIWTLDADGNLVITGTGDMRDYDFGTSPFYKYADRITSVSLPDGLTSIGERAFDATFPNLDHIEIPTSVTHIQECAFGATYNKVKLKYPGTMAQWEDLYIAAIASYGIQYGAECSDGTIIYMGPCSGSNGLYDDVQYMLLGDGTLKITGSGAMTFYRYLNYESCFSGDDKITKVVIDEGVTSIAGYAFKNCKNLTEVHIPASVTSISYDVFTGCTSLTDIYYGSNEKNWSKMNISSDSDLPEDVTIHYTNLCTAGHTWVDASCTAPKTCSVCDATEGEPQHTWVAATCSAPKTCSLCGETEGSVDDTFHHFTYGICDDCGAIQISETTFPDANFRAYITSQTYGADGVLTNEELQNVKSINVSYKNIKDLTGIQYFTALEKLSCVDNQLTALDVSGLTVLNDLDCSYNQLTSLDVSGLTALKDLNCRSNQLTSLDVSGLTALEELECQVNQLTSLDVSNLAALKTLYCSDNQLTELDVSGLPVLEELWCLSNQLTSLDVSGLTALEHLDCSDNQLTELDVSGLTALDELWCWSNQLTSLDVSGLTALYYLECEDNQLTSLDVSKNTALEYLSCSSNQLTSLDLSGLTALTYLYCDGNERTVSATRGQFDLSNLAADGFDISKASNWQGGEVTGNILTATAENVTYTYDLGNGETATFTLVIDGFCSHTWLDATCSAPKTCSSCGATEGEVLGHDWADADCETAKTCKVCGETEGAPLNHNWTPADCENPKTCTRCGETEGEALDHDWVDADCETAKTCKVCGETEGAPLDHNWTPADCENPKTCKRCGATEGTSIGHAWIDATCYNPKTCNNCGTTVGEMLKHDWVEADCEQPKHCKNCTATEGSAPGHDWAAADCENPKTCKRCGKTEGTYIGHSWIEASCYNPRTCSVCGKIDSVSWGHDWQAVVDGTGEICNKCGATRGDVHSHTWLSATCSAPETCTSCGVTRGEKLPHTPVVDPAVEATCTTEGKSEGSHCSVCLQPLVVQQVIPVKAHTEVIDPAVPATCTADGLTEGKHCTVCGKATQPQRVVTAAGHKDHDRNYICDVCAEDLCTEHQEEILPAKAATCTETGLTEGKKCARCGDILVAQQTIPALGHSEVVIPGTAATCTGLGKTDGKRCQVCNTMTVPQQTIPAKGHTEVIDPAVAATCTAAGKTEGSHCSACGEVIAAQQAIPAKGHSAVEDAAVAATCTAAGKTAGSHCSICGAVIVAQRAIPAKGHNWAPGNCTTPKTCTTCGTKDGGVVHAYEHRYDYKCDLCGTTRPVDMTRPMVDMFRMYDPNSGEHFYTGSMEERENLVAVGWQYEGVGFTFPLTTGDPVHRLYDPVYGEHLYTMDVEEMNALLAAGWLYEGIAFNSGFENEVPQYRLHNPNATRGAYHFTASLEERDMLIALGWEYQGIGWYSLGG